MKTQFLVTLVLLTMISVAHGAVEPVSPQQGEYEKSINAVVRHKSYYKAGRFEVGGAAGVMPYDSVVNHYMLAGRFSWHLTDHLGWEVLDAQVTFPSVTSFTTDLVVAKGISNLQTSQLKAVLGTNLLVSPVYGKIRFFGSQVLYFDIYVVLGGGFAKTDTLKFSSPGINLPLTQSTVRSGFEPMFDFGFGFKIFMNRAVGLVIDMRDYVVYTETYGKKGLRSNFAVFAGLSFFLPTF